MDDIIFERYDSEARKLVLVTDKAEVIHISDYDGNGEPTPADGIHYSEGQADVILKNVGSIYHPSGMQEFNFRYERIGRRVFLDGRVRFGPDFVAGGGTDEFWLDIVGPVEIKPDFTAGSIESVGSFHGYGAGVFPGNAYWSTNVGSGKDGIRFTVGNKHVSKSYPTEWKGQDHWRIHLSWSVP